MNDCVNGLLFSAKHTKRKIDVFNVGNHDMINVLDIASIVCISMKLGNVKVITSGGTDDGRGWIGDVRKMKLDTSKMCNLGWNPIENSQAAVERATLELVSESM